MKRTKTYIRNSLIKLYSQEEIESFISMIFFHIYNYSKKELILNADRVLDSDEIDRIEGIVSRLVGFEPIQYVLGVAEFYDMEFVVNENVLIPRGETEELVHLILTNHASAKHRVLDIGSGSGCIPITLKKKNPNFEVISCDISDDALNVARANAKRNCVLVDFLLFDILSSKSFPEKDFDLIVSNPPYVTDKEKEFMEANVLEHEPHLALFVSDDDPLLFYRKITQRAVQLLKKSGTLYFEINEAYGNDVMELMTTYGFDCSLLRDLNGKDRMVVGRKI